MVAPLPPLPIAPTPQLLHGTLLNNLKLSPPLSLEAEARLRAQVPPSSTRRQRQRLLPVVEEEPLLFMVNAVE